MPQNCARIKRFEKLPKSLQFLKTQIFSHALLEILAKTPHTWLIIVVFLSVKYFENLNLNNHKNLINESFLKYAQLWNLPFANYEGTVENVAVGAGNQILNRINFVWEKIIMIILPSVQGIFLFHSQKWHPYDFPE